MKVHFFTIVTAVLCLYASAQVFRPRTLSKQPEYRTCIGKTAAGDEMRVTFFSRRRTSNWRQSGSLTNDIQIKATINSRSLTDKFRLVTTQYGRIDGMCESESLGNIIDESAFTRTAIFQTGGQKITNIGYIGTDFSLSPGKSVRIADHLQTRLNLDILAGGGVALCPVQQIVGTRCIDLIPLCCAISRDTRPADIVQEHGLSGDISGDQFPNVQTQVGENPVGGKRIVLANGNVQTSTGVIVNPVYDGDLRQSTNLIHDDRLNGNNPTLNRRNIGATNGVEIAPMQIINSVQRGSVQG